MKILVTGAAGQLGAAVVAQLLNTTAATNIAVFVRNAAKVTALEARGVAVHIGDYDDIISLEQAMVGIDKVLLIAGTNEEKRLQQHRNVIAAAKKMGVGSIAYTSRCLNNRHTLVNKLMLGHFETEDDIMASGLQYTLFRNILYMDVIPNFVGEKVFETGINLSVGTGKVSFCLRKDMGEAIANTLLLPVKGNNIYNLTGSTLYSFADVATALTALSGKNVAYTPITQTQFESILTAKSLPAFVVQRIIGFMCDIENGQETTISTDLEILLGRKPTTLQAGLKMIYQL
jgi:NAD(P)H dehydrogenase (quinone)